MNLWPYLVGKIVAHRKDALTIGGLYLEDCQEAIPYNPEISTLTGYMPYALSADHAEQLWTIAEKLVEL